MTYLNYVTLAHNLICIACLCFTLYASLVLLFKKSNNNVSHTPTVYAYFWFTTTSSILLSINAAYILIFWRSNEIIYNPMILYYIGGIPTVYVNLVPVADFFLCLDRCFLVSSPLKYNRIYDKLIGVAFGLTIGGILLLYILTTNYFAFYTSQTKTLCVYYICLVYELNYPQIMAYMKYVFCSLGLAAAAILIGINYFGKSLQKELSTKLNKSIILVSVINIAFAFIPTLVVVGFSANGIKIMDYIGDFNLTCVCINISLCVFLYYRVYQKHFLKAITGITAARMFP